MSRIAQAFGNASRKAFIPFITCGDPDLATTAAAVRAMAGAGADLIELRIPFSDPTAEGPVIQEASNRALKAGTTTDKVFDLVRDLRRDVSVPMVFMTYANVVFSYGAQRFIATAAEVGIDGLILPDIPFEEKEEFDGLCKLYGLDLISLIAPTSDNRIAMISREASGFLYVVSSLGVTGMRSEITTDIGAMIALIRQNTSLPCAVGFGISTPEQAAAMARLSDGAIVGSAIVKLLAQYGRAAVPEIARLVQSMSAAVHGVK
ncbi:MAG: tryptophan synthase subunit alpha [Gemmiger sp.]|nr:tryptophan synthase subunit alpha [Gemmiger sp.]MDY5784220.1 tryptophan synthase subunit alpha [Gemmiger sp.]